MFVRCQDATVADRPASQVTCQIPHDLIGLACVRRWRLNVTHPIDRLQLIAELLPLSVIGQVSELAAKHQLATLSKAPKISDRNLAEQFSQTDGVDRVESIAVGGLLWCSGLLSAVLLELG